MSIDIGKTDDPKNNSKTTTKGGDITQEMAEKVDGFCQSLLTDSNKFDNKAVFEDIKNYISEYNRILYAPISNTIYACYNDHDVDESSNIIGTMNSNIESVVAYTQDPEYTTLYDEAGDEDKRKLKDTEKAILKIWDHINLAQQQYSALRQSDAEYQKKFDKNISPIKDTIVKDLNAQLLTMIGIFTALAFLIFGGISSLENIFSNVHLPLIKLMIIGSIWGLCILNLVFVFLFCVGKMTKLNFKSTDNVDATLFQKYPIVWWSNFTIISIMVLSIWIYYIQNKDADLWIDKICTSYPIKFTVAGTILIALVIFLLFKKLIKATKNTGSSDS